MIPKKIHYCWFGRGEKSDKAKKCIASWHKFCPDYEIVEWNEDNFDVGMNAYTEMCVRERKFAFLSDYARLVVLEREGGLYFDVDVELVRNPDKLLENKAFFGFETPEYVSSGLGFGVEAGNPAVQAMLAMYDGLLDGTHGTVGCPILNTKALEQFGLVRNGAYQDLGCAVIYPADYFNPYDDVLGKLKKTENTYSVHWYAKSWMDCRTVLRSKLSKPWHRLQHLFGKR